jgi:glycosyltransferase involved in cell wall biosynthesis
MCSVGPDRLEGDVLKRVLLLIKGLGRGGAEQLLLSAACHLDRRRFDYEVAYLLPHKDALVAELRTAGLPVHCLGGVGKSWMGRLRALAKERDIKLIHVHLPYSAMEARLAFPRRSGPRIVYTEHGPWDYYRRPTYLGNMLTFFRNDHVFAVSEDVSRSIRYPTGLSFLRMPPVETLHHGVDLQHLDTAGSQVDIRSEFGLPANTIIVGTVANFRRQKRHDVLLQAVERVQRVRPNARFILVGQGPLEDDARRLAEKLGVGGAVVFAGFRPDVPRLMHAFDIFALSSEWEGLPIALLEAMYCGKPSVVTGVGGVREALEDDKEGIVVPPNDPESLAQGMLRLIDNEWLRNRLGERARARAREFDIRKAVRHMEAVYEELLS